MALGNTPKRLTNIYLEANKSFALNVRFTNEDGSPYDVTGSEVRLVARSSSNAYSIDSSTPLFRLVAEHEEPLKGLVQFKFQASDLSVVPGEYPFDVTLLSVRNYSTPVLKGNLVIGFNADPENANTFTDVYPGTELEVLFGNSCDVVACVQHLESDHAHIDTTWTLVGGTDPGDPTTLANPGGTFSSPLWIDLSETYTPGSPTDPIDPDVGGDPEWRIPELLNGWVNYTVGFTTKPGVYRKLNSGLVVLEGSISPGRTGAVILTLPTGYRPNDGRLTFNVACEEGTCRLDLLATGDLVHISGTPGAWVSLSDISFYGEAGSDIPGEPPGEEEDMYGEHIIVWNPDAGAWVYRGNVVMARPLEIPSYNQGSRAVWDTSLDETITTPPPLAVVGDVWFPHGDVDPLNP